MKISVDVSGLDVIAAKMRGLSDKKINVAVVASLNQAARVGYESVRNEMGKVFDRPTPWVIGGAQYKKATSAKLEAQVDFDKWGNKTGVTVEKVLGAEITGGPRKYKRHEIAMQRAGILPNGYYIVPGEAAQLDQYGNMKGSEIVKIMSWFRAFGEQGYRANTTDKRKAALLRGTKKNNNLGFQYFAVIPGSTKTHLHPGIYTKAITGFGSSIRPIMMFVKAPNYRKRLDFYGIATREAEQEIKRVLPIYLKQMLIEQGL